MKRMVIYKHVITTLVVLFLMTGVEAQNIVYSFEADYNEEGTSFGLRVTDTTGTSSHNHHGEYLIALSSRGGGELYHFRINSEWNSNYSFAIERLSGNIYSDDVVVVQNTSTHFNLEIRFHGVQNDWHRITVHEIIPPRAEDYVTFQHIDPSEFLTGDKVVLTKEIGRINFSDSVGIGTTTPDEKLTVAGTVKSREVIVEENTGADFVFEEGYTLPSLVELEAYIKTNRHLPEIPTAEHMKAEGVKVGELQMKLLQKIEELTLYVIELEKRDREKQKRIEFLENQIKRKHQ